MRVGSADAPGSAGRAAHGRAAYGKTGGVKLTRPANLPRVLAPAIALGLLLMSAGFYLFPDYGAVARCFYLLVLLPVVVLTLLRPAALAMPVLHALVFLPLPLYLALSTTWGLAGTAAPGAEQWDLVKPALFLAALLAGSHLAQRRYPHFPALLPRVIVLFALPSALIGLAQYLPQALQSGDWPRMAGISLRGDINVNAALHGLNCLFCAWGLRHWSQRWRPWLWCALPLSLVTALLSQSKVGLLLGLLAVAALAWSALRHSGRQWLATGLALAGLALLLAFFAGFERIPFLYRLEGYSVRLDLWSQGLAQAASHPWLGHGLGADLPLTRFGEPYHSHVHNVLLGTLRYGGVIGLGLILWQVGATVWLVWRERLWRGDEAALLMWWLAGLAFLLTNGSQPLLKPHHTWFFYWIPLAQLLAIAADRLQKPSTSK